MTSGCFLLCMVIIPQGMLRHKGSKATVPSHQSHSKRCHNPLPRSAVRKRERKGLGENAWDTPMVVTSKVWTWLDCWKTKEHNMPFLI